ncbi:MAG: hypothetical protein L6R19_08875 [Alphaproteobacteria bacterium]|nr:hypothetical protein [Alphaproteobacteria bacterium]
MTGSNDASRSSGDSERGATIQFAKKTTIVAVAVVLSLVIAVEWTLASLDEFVNRNSERAIGRIEQAIRGSSQILATEMRNTTQMIVADLRGSATGTRVVARLERGLEWMAHPATEPSPERREKLLSAIRVVSERWRPMILEAFAIIVGADGADAAKR